MKTLLLGLGNPILCDDSVGIRVAEVIRDRCPKIEMLEASAAGFRIADQLIGYDKIILIDAIQTGSAAAGTLHRFTPEDFRSTHNFNSPHDMNLFEALDILEQYGASLPSEIVIYGIEVSDIQTFSESCTPDVAQAIPAISQKIIETEMLTESCLN